MAQFSRMAAQISTKSSVIVIRSIPYSRTSGHEHALQCLRRSKITTMAPFLRWANGLTQLFILVFGAVDGLLSKGNIPCICRRNFNSAGPFKFCSPLKKRLLSMKLLQMGGISGLVTKVSLLSWLSD